MSTVKLGGSMLIARFLLATLFVVIGPILIYRVLLFGVNVHALPGVILGVAIGALGVYRIRQILTVWRGA